MYLASRDLKKTLSGHFSRLRVPPRDPPVWRPYSSRSTPGPQKGPRELPGTPQEPLRAPPGPPRAPLKLISWHHFLFEILDVQFLHAFPHYFNKFAIGLFVCKCALVSFYIYVLRILTILQISFIFQTPPRPPRGPPQDPPGTPPGPSRTPRGPSRTRADGVGPYSWFRLVKY